MILKAAGMKIQLPVRWSDRKRPTENDAMLKRLLGSEEAEAIDDEDIEHIYGSAVLDTKDIRAYNDLDEDHCILRTYYNDSYCVALSLESLKQIMVELTGENITMIRKEAPKKSPKKNPKKKEDDDDIII